MIITVGTTSNEMDKMSFPNSSSLDGTRRCESATSVTTNNMTPIMAMDGDVSPTPAMVTLETGRSDNGENSATANRVMASVKNRLAFSGMYTLATRDTTNRIIGAYLRSACSLCFGLTCRSRCVCGDSIASFGCRDKKRCSNTAN